MADALSTILETREAERLATGFGFTEGPLWHPDGRADTGEGNGTTSVYTLRVKTPGRPQPWYRTRTR
jgi:hypothetical protein